MIVYRIAKKAYANDLSGEGAKLYGGRWNNKGIPCVYTAESRALAMLEFTVNLDMDFLPGDLVLSAIEIPARDIFIVDRKKLPADWKTAPAPVSIKNMGSLLLREKRHAIIKVPSVIMEEEFNYILNPLHITARQFKIISTRPLAIDGRLAKK